MGLVSNLRPFGEPCEYAVWNSSCSVVIAVRYNQRLEKELATSTNNTWTDHNMPHCALYETVLFSAKMKGKQSD